MVAAPSRSSTSTAPALRVEPGRFDRRLGPQRPVDHVREHLGHRRHDLPAARRAHGEIRRAVTQRQEGRHVHQGPLARGRSSSAGRAPGSNQIIPFERSSPVSGTTTLEPNRLTAVWVSDTSVRSPSTAHTCVVHSSLEPAAGARAAPTAAALEAPRVHAPARVTSAVGPDPVGHRSRIGLPRQRGPRRADPRRIPEPPEAVLERDPESLGPQMRGARARGAGAPASKHSRTFSVSSAVTQPVAPGIPRSVTPR